MTDPSTILNWRRWDHALTLSGQPTEDELHKIKDLGVDVVINLGPHSNDGALEDEPGSVARLGLRYIYIPVDFDAPTEDDFTRFCAALNEVSGQMAHVHCIYNARVSAFFYRYACAGLGGDRDQAFALMDGIWRPGGVWAAFISDSASISLPNRYAGYDYACDPG